MQRSLVTVTSRNDPFTNPWVSTKDVDNRFVLRGVYVRFSHSNRGSSNVHIVRLGSIVQKRQLSVSAIVSDSFAYRLNRLDFPALGFPGGW